MQVVYLVKDLTIVFYSLTGVVFQKEKKGSCLTCTLKERGLESLFMECKT